jgi:hypothetical protein
LSRADPFVADDAMTRPQFRIRTVMIVVVLTAVVAGALYETASFRREAYMALADKYSAEATRVSRAGLADSSGLHMAKADEYMAKANKYYALANRTQSGVLVGLCIVGAGATAATVTFFILGCARARSGWTPHTLPAAPRPWAANKADDPQAE